MEASERKQDGFAVDSETMSKIAEIRVAIADVLLEIDSIVLQINPQIEADYMVKIGCLENELLQVQIAARRARRKVALAQARENEGLPVDDDDMEAVLNAEFKAWEKQLKSQVDQYLQALESRQGTLCMTPTEQRAFKALHRKLIKRLHPDLNPGQTGEAARFFMVAQTAFERGDREMLKSIDVATEGMEGSRDCENLTTDELFAECELASARLHVVEEQLEEIKRQNPYAMKDKLADPEWICAQVGLLQSQIEEQKQAKHLYDERFCALKGGGADGR